MSDTNGASKNITEGNALVNKFLKVVYHFNGKSKDQVDKTLIEEVKYLEQLRVNEGYEFHSVRKLGMKHANGSVEFEIVFLLKVEP